MVKFKRILSFSTAVQLTCILYFVTPAKAQTIDYGRLQDIFQEPVTTSATGTPQRVSEVAADMTVITADQIRQAGTRSIPQIIGIYTPGVNVLQENTNTFDVSMGGYQHPYNSRLLVLIDGRQVFSDDYSRTPWNNLPINVDDIRQIEVVNGTSSALFGSNATSGVVNIITYSPLYDDNNVVSTSFGTENTVSADGTVTAKLGDSAGFKVSTGGYGNKPMRQDTNFAADNPTTTDLYQRYLLATGAYKAGPKVVVNTEFSFSDDYNPETVNELNSIPVETTSYSGRAGLTWNSPIGQVKSDNYINQNALVYDISSGPVLQPHNSLIVSHLEDLFEVGSANTFRAMLEYRNKTSVETASPTLQYQKTSLNEATYAVGGTWLWHITDDLTLTNAVRYDANTLQPDGTLAAISPYQYPQSSAFSTVSINSGIVYQASSLDTVRLTYGRGVQNPSFFNSGYNFNFAALPPSVHPNFLENFEANPDLDPVVVQTYELGYDRKVNEISSTVRGSVFHQINQALVSSTTTASFVNPNVVLLIDDQNIGNSSSTGGQISLGGSDSGFRWDASYSFQAVDDSPEVKRLMMNEGSAPQSQYRLSVGYSWNDWEIDTHSQYETATDMLRNTGVGNVAVPIKGFYTLTARLGYKLNDYVTASLYGTNLTRQETAESPYAIIEKRVFCGLTGKF